MSVLFLRRLWATLLAAGVAASAAAFAAEGHPSLRPWPVLGLWAGSIVLFLAGARIFDGTVPVAPKRRLTIGELRFLFVLTAAAVLVRAVALPSVPHTFGGDEGEMGSFARGVVSGDWTDPFTTGWLGHPTLWFFVQALSLEVFGDDVFGLRMLSALIGAATVPLLYLFARESFGRTVAGAAAVLFCAYHFHIHFSRLGLNNVADPALMLVALTALLAGFRRRSPYQFAIAGLAAGVAQHFYFGSRLVPLVLVAVVLHQLVLARANLARVARFLPLSVVGFGVGYGPAIRVPLYHWDDFNARLRLVGIFQSGWFDEHRALGESSFGILAHQVKQAAGAFTHVPDSGVHYAPGMPLLDSVSAACFLAGVLLVLLAWRRSESAALVSWLAGTVLAGGVLIVNPPESPRYVTAAPAACLVVSLAIVRAVAAAERLVTRLRPVAPALVAAVVAGLSAWSLAFYFRDYSSRNSYGGRQGEENTAIGNYLRARGRDAYVLFFGAPWTYFNVGTIRFLAPEVEGTDVLERLTRPQDLPGTPAARRPLFLFVPARAGELAVVRRRYAGGVTRTFTSGVDGGVLFVSYEPGPAA
jgi:4-amino-4-deoxy-L-arabinose transferase-like glycosyltransferase